MRILTTIVLFCIATFGLVSCNWITSQLRSFPQANHNPDQNIILFRPQLTANGSRPMPVSVQLEMVRAANVSLKSAGKDTLKISHWCPCDSALVLLEGKQLDDLLINGREVASNTRPSGGVEGNPPFNDIKFDKATNMLNWPQSFGVSSPNYITTLPFYNLPKDSTAVMPFLGFNLPNQRTEKPFIIAVMDTGIQPDLYPTIKGRFWVNPEETVETDRDRNGLVGDITGWNFVTNTNLPYDSNGHGTLVTSLIHEQLRNNAWAAKNVRYMYLKTYNKHGKGTLFNNLCAMSYARQKGVKIINASWGFYSPQESALLGYFLQELKESDITFVAAAGNEDDELEQNWFGIVPSLFYRNLGVNPFWPANYSLDHENVITVTTIHPKANARIYPHSRDDYNGYEVCADQNLSNDIVSVGVFNNRNGRFDFCDVLNITVPGNTDASSGSSFAAPVVTGKMVEKLGAAWSSGKREVLLSGLAQTTPNATSGLPPVLAVLATHPSLSGQIKGSQYVKRVTP
jgi:hypothetical protein